MTDAEKQAREHATEMAAAGALLGVSVLGILQLLQVPVLSRWLDFAVYAFAIAIPLLASGTLLLMEAHKQGKDEALEGIRSLPAPLGALGVIAGLGACIAHHHLVAGLLFWAIGILCFSFTAKIEIRIDKDEAPPRRPE